MQSEMEAMPLIDSALSYSPATSSVMASIDEDEMTLEAKQCLSALKEGKRSVHHLASLQFSSIDMSCNSNELSYWA